MSIIYLICILAVIGLLLWVVNQYVPMPPLFKTVMNVVVVIMVIAWLAGTFFGHGSFRL